MFDAGEEGRGKKSTHATFPTPNVGRSLRSWMQFLARKKGTGGKRGKGGKGPSRSSHDHYILLLLLLGLLLQLPSPFRLKDSLAQFSQEGGDSSGTTQVYVEAGSSPLPPRPISTTTQQSSSSTVAANFSLVPPPPFLFKRKRAFDFPLLYFLSRVSAVF